METADSSVFFTPVQPPVDKDSRHLADSTTIETAESKEPPADRPLAIHWRKDDVASPTTSQPSVDEATLKRFVPFRNLDDASLARLAAQARLVGCRRGEYCLRNGQPGDQMLFLLNGELWLSRPNLDDTRVKAGSMAANFPLNCEAGIPIDARAMVPSTLAALPRALLGSLHAGKARDEGMSVVEGGIEETLFVEFHETLVNGSLDLPSMPGLAMQIMRSIDREDTGSAEVARIIQTDPSLTTRIVQVVNSPLYAGEKRIDNCPDAVTRLGLEATRNTAISFLLKNLFNSDSPLLRKRMHQLWLHSVRVASIAAILARITPGLDPDRAMLGGLIHDIGVIPILNNAQHHPELSEHPAVLEKAIAHLRAEIGVATLRNWDFGEDFQAIARHATDFTYQAEGSADYTEVVQIARMHSLIGTPAAADQPRIDQVPAFSRLALGKLSPRLSIAVLDKAEQEIRAVAAMLG